MTVNRQLILPQWQRRAAGHPQLPFHQVLPGDHFRHRMFDLQAGIHFHEVERAILVGDEFDRAGADIADRLRRCDRCLAHGAPAFVVHARCRRFLEHFLVAALHRAVAFEEVDAVAVAVGEDLDFDMPWPVQVLLDQHLVVAETADRFPLAGSQCRLEIDAAFDDPHALAAAAGRCLEQYGIAHAVGCVLQELRLLALAVITGNQWHAGLFHQRFGRRFGTHGVDRGCRRSDEDDAGLGTGAGKVGVLRQKTVPRMDRLRAGRLCCSDDLVDPQVALLGSRRTDRHRFIAQRHVTRTCIGFRVDGDRLDAKPPRRGRDPAGDLATIGDQDFSEHGVSGMRSWIRPWERSGERVECGSAEP